MSVPNGPLGQLVSFEGASGVRLDGMLYTTEGARRTLVHCHGSFGNFYQNEFVRILAAELQQMGMNFLVFNLSAHDGVAEGYFADGTFRYIGGSIVDFATCIEDIQGAISFARSVAAGVGLSGHSLGCDRIVAAALRCGLRSPLVLLAPCDSYAIQRNLIAPEAVEAQRKRVASVTNEMGDAPCDLDWLPLGEYGVKSTREWTYPNPITRGAFLSISGGAPFRLFRYEQRPAWHSEAPALIVSPGEDALLTVPPARVGGFFNRAFERCSHVVVPGDHMFSGSEQRLARVVSEWLSAVEEQVWMVE